MLALRDHISHCRECRDEHYSLKTMKYLLSALPEKEPNPDWVVLLAESISRPTPTLLQNLRTHWGRSMDAVSSLFVLKGGRETALVQNRRLISALMISAVGAFLITMPFDRPTARQSADSGAVSTSSPQTASASFIAPWYGAGQVATHPALRPGEMEFIAVPLPPQMLAGETPNLLPQSDFVRPIQPGYRDNYLTSINMHVIPPPNGMGGFGAPWQGPRLAVSPTGR